MSASGAGTYRRALAMHADQDPLGDTARLWTMPYGDCGDPRAGRGPAQSVAGWLLARLALSECCRVRPQDWKFARDGRGKPFIFAPLEYRGISISISHTDGLVACLISEHALAAVDVERVTPWEDLSFIAPTILSAEEQHSIETLEGDAWVRRFFEYWTLKEAYAKALGVGLAFDFSSVSFDFGPGCDVAARFTDGVGEVASDWLFRRLALGPDWAGSVAAKTGPSKTCRLVHVELTPDILMREVSSVSC